MEFSQIREFSAENPLRRRLFVSGRPGPAVPVCGTNIWQNRKYMLLLLPERWKRGALQGSGGSNPSLSASEDCAAEHQFCRFFVGAGFGKQFFSPAPTFSLAPLGAIFFQEKALLTNNRGCGTKRILNFQRSSRECSALRIPLFPPERIAAAEREFCCFLGSGPGKPIFESMPTYFYYGKLFVTWGWT